MALNVSPQMVQKLADAGDHAVLDSEFRSNADGTHAEMVLGTQGLYISSEADGWTLRGPFPVAL